MSTRRVVTGTNESGRSYFVHDGPTPGHLDLGVAVVVRCGVVHQFYAKDIPIVAIDPDAPFNDAEGHLAVNCLGFYRKVLQGLRKVRDYIMNASPAELDVLDFKLSLRMRLDEEELGGASPSLRGLPKA
jgi:hypothetical protein